MSSYSTNEIRGGMKLLIDGDPYAVIDNEYVKPGKGQAFNRIRVRNLRTGAVLESLIPAIRRLRGCLHYYAAIDRGSSSMVNVSVWRELADAHQMRSLAAMRALAEEFSREGVRFEQPIIDYQTLWQLG